MVLTVRGQAASLKLQSKMEDGWMEKDGEKYRESTKCENVKIRLHKETTDLGKTLGTCQRLSKHHLNKKE